MISSEKIITIIIIIVGTLITRYLPFILFPEDKALPESIKYLGYVLPYAAIGLLVVYCLKDVSFFSGNHGIPEIISMLFIIFLHTWRKSTLLSIGIGTVIYMALIRII